MNGGANAEKSPRNSPFHLRHMDPIQYINAWAHPTHMPNDNSIGSRSSAQVRNKGPIGYNKWHPDPISHFATIHFPDTQTEKQIDRQTDRWSRRQVHIMSAPPAMLIDSDALTTTDNTRLMAHCPGLPGCVGTRKIKPVWIYWSKRQ